MADLWGEWASSRVTNRRFYAAGYPEDGDLYLSVGFEIDAQTGDLVRNSNETGLGKKGGFSPQWRWRESGETRRAHSIPVAGFDWISLCTDYGWADGFVAACHGVIARIAPRARVLDVTHAIAPGDVRHGSVVLADTLPWLPPAVHVAVVDPGVGTARRGIALVSGDAVLVGPDNGLLVPAARALDGVRAAYELVEPSYQLPTVSATFHGRDVFAPAAAHLAHGVPPDALGPAVDPASLFTLPTPVCQVDGDRIRVEVLSVDHFGNVALAAGAAELAAVGLRAGESVTLRWPTGVRPVLVGRTFADGTEGELVLLVDSAGHLAVACRGGSAARRTGLRPGTVVELVSARSAGSR